MKPLVSVIIPIYNGQDFIYGLIESMMNQTISFENLELIFINNKSTDNSKQLLNEYSLKYDNVKIIHLEKHYPTPGHSRNIGIKEASADYLMFLDQDDSYLADFCKTMYDLISSENVDLVTSRYTVNKNNERYLNNSFLAKDKPLIKLNSIKEYPEVIQTQANLTVWNKIYRNSYLQEKNICFVEEHWAEDYLFALEAYIEANGIILLNDYSGYLYLINDESESHSQPSKSDYHNNCIVPLYKVKKLLLQNNMDYSNYTSEFLVTWVKLFLYSDLDVDDLSKIYNEFKIWLKEYKLTTRLVNLSYPINILINIAMKIFSLSKRVMILSNKIFSKISK